MDKKTVLTLGYITRCLPLILLACGFAQSIQAAEIGVSSKSIKVASILDLKGKTKNTGVSVLEGMKAGIANEIIQGRRIKLITKNDFGNPSRTKDAFLSLVARKPFMFIGNTDRSANPIALDMLMKNKTPALGFINGTDKLRENQRNISNYRASYIQEVKTVVLSALEGGIKPTGICIYTQNDQFGMMAVKGVKSAFQNLPSAKSIIPSLNEILASAGKHPERNNIGPVGVYKPKTYISRQGYDSLKNWENTKGTRCKLVITMGDQHSISRFIGYSRYKDEKWIISLASSTDTQLFQKDLDKFNDQALLSQRLILTHVTPYLSSDLPIVHEARLKLGQRLNYASLEGYINSKIMLYILRNISGTLNQANFIDNIRNAHFDLGGINIDFREGNQGSNLVVMSTLKNKRWEPLNLNRWQDWKR